MEEFTPKLEQDSRIVITGVSMNQVHFFCSCCLSMTAQKGVLVCALRAKLHVQVFFEETTLFCANCRTLCLQTMSCFFDNLLDHKDWRVRCGVDWNDCLCVEMIRMSLAPCSAPFGCLSGWMQHCDIIKVHAILGAANVWLHFFVFCFQKFDRSSNLYLCFVDFLPRDFVAHNVVIVRGERKTL